MSDYENLQEGEHEGRLVMVADLGWHEDEYQGVKKKPAKKAAIGIEIVDSTVEINREEQPRLLWTRPFNVFLQPKGVKDLLADSLLELSPSILTALWCVSHVCMSLRCLLLLHYTPYRNHTNTDQEQHRQERSP